MSTRSTPPADRHLPPGRHDQRRRELLAVIATEEPAADEPRTVGHPGRLNAGNRWLAPLAAAAGVVAILVSGSYLAVQPHATHPGPGAKGVAPNAGSGHRSATPARLRSPDPLTYDIAGMSIPGGATSALVTGGQLATFLQVCLRRAAHGATPADPDWSPPVPATYQPVIGISDSRSPAVTHAIAQTPAGSLIGCTGPLRSSAKPPTLSGFTPGTVGDETTKGHGPTSLGTAVSVLGRITEGNAVFSWGRYSRKVSRVIVQYPGFPEHEAKMAAGVWIDLSVLPFDGLVSVLRGGVTGQLTPGSRTATAWQYHGFPVVQAFGKDGATLASMTSRLRCAAPVATVTQCQISP